MPAPPQAESSETLPRFYLATGNAHKAQEFASILRAARSPYEVRRVPQMPKVDESAPDYAGNADLKAKAAQEVVGHDALIVADDSGLEVEALNGRPGVFSARYAGPDATDRENLEKLLNELRVLGGGPWTAAFVCVLSLRRGEQQVTAMGRCPGMIVAEPSGEGGFGYDPVFRPEGFTQTFAELGEAVKRERSHRALAVRALLEAWPSWAYQA